MRQRLSNFLLRTMPEHATGNHRPHTRALKALALACLGFGLTTAPATGQIVPVGAGSYTTVFPGTDVAGRNSVPMGTAPMVSGVAATKPVPTNDFWSAKLQKNHVGNIFNYPLAYRTDVAGLGINHITPNQAPLDYRQPNSNVMGVLVGVQNLNATAATVSNYSDWTVTMNWHSGSNDFNATIGMGMPFTYFTKGASDVARVTVSQGTVTISGEMLLILDTYANADYAVYAPVGSTWTNAGANTYTSTLSGKTYWSVAFLPPATTMAAVQTSAQALKKHAYVFPANTQVAWQYNQTTAVMTSTFTVTPSVKEGTNSTVLQGLLPHQWGHLAGGSAQPAGPVYNSVRGALKMLDGNTFSVANTFHGILPTLPYLDNYSAGFSPVKLNDKVKALQNSGLAEWTDSYNEGQDMNKLMQTARIAHEAGNIEARDKMVTTIKTRLEDWLTAEAGEKAFIFYYNNTWKTMIGYPAGHNQDFKLNDHHFHWGYFIQAATLIEQFQPGWATQWKPMINLLIRDAANPSRTDSDFPFLRSFDPYAGHAWADGFAMTGTIATEEPQGNNQESTPESMQFNSALIHWGAVTGDNAIRDLGIYLYTTEQTAAEDYWFDTHDRTFQPNYPYTSTARIWGSGYDAGTWWTSDVRAMYGIQLYPIHGGSLYLGQDTAYVRRHWNDMVANTGILQNEVNPNLWHDVMWQYLAFIDPAKAIQLYDGYPNRSLKVGVSDAQTYYWLHSMNVLGALDASVTANHPVAAVFKKNGQKTYVAHNYSNAAITVTFSDGFTLPVPAKKLATSRDVNVAGTITPSATEVAANASVTLSVATTGTGITGVQFFDGTTSLGTVTSAPYTRVASNLPVAIHNFYARVYAGANFKVTNIATVQVGNQVSYTGSPQPIPGTIQAGNYDTYPGGLGQGIAYEDVSPVNEAIYGNSGAIRTNEYVDAATDPAEGATVGWVSDGEWLEYTVNVATAGTYSLALHYASGNADGGGPFYVSLDGVKKSGDISVVTTGAGEAGWSTWAIKTVSGLVLPAGQHVLRLTFVRGGFNVGRLVFTGGGGGTNTPPVANAGTDVSITLPTASAALNGSMSNDPDGQTIIYAWTRLSGPSTPTFSSTTVAQPTVSGLVQGSYVFRLTVSDGTASATDDVTVTVAPQGTTGGTCTGGPTNGDYTYSMSGATSNPTLTFTPGRTGVGNPTLLLYYGTSPNGPYPGYIVQPNVPFTLTAGPGQTVYFYYTYSVPEGGERNTSATPHNAAVGSCGGGTNTPPTVSLTAPTNGAAFTAPASITISANASDANGTVSQVAFYNGATLLGTDTSSPYSYTWTGVAAGTYSITAKATDNAAAVTTSTAVSVTVSAGNTPPTVSITSPAGGATFTAPASITINANAADANGTVTQVAFYNGATLLGTDTSSPYSYSWTNVAAGTYSLTARATDNAGAVTTSAAVSVTVSAGNTPPTVSITSPTNGAAFTAPASITINANAADANGTVSQVAFYNGATLLGTDTSSPYSYAWTGVGAGTYSLTARATDNAGAVTTSAAVSVTVNAGNTPPTVSITSPAGGASFTAPASITINANAADANGTVTQVAFYNGATLLGTDTSSPYSYAWTGVGAGTYSLTARATDNAGAVTTSAAVSVTVGSGSSYCATTADFSYGAVTSGGNVTFTFRPLGGTVGGNLAIIYIREGAAGGYPGYVMTKNGAGDFTFTRAIASGTVLSIYFTYQYGTGGPERNNAATPFSYTVGNSCGALRAAAPTTATFGSSPASRQAEQGSPAARAAAILATDLQVAPNPAEGQATVSFVLAQDGPYTLTLCDLNGREVQRQPTGLAAAGRQVVTLPTAAYPAGVYMLRLVTGQQVHTLRLVLTR